MTDRIRMNGRGGIVPPGATYIGQAMPAHYTRGLALPKSKFANPFYKVRPREQAVDLYHEWLFTQPSLLDAARRELAGKDLECWCPLDQPCHADVLFEILDDMWCLACAAGKTVGHLSHL